MIREESHVYKIKLGVKRLFNLSNVQISSENKVIHYNIIKNVTGRDYIILPLHVIWRAAVRKNCKTPYKTSFLFFHIKVLS